MAFRKLEPRARQGEPGPLKAGFFALATAKAFSQKTGLKLALWTLVLAQQVRGRGYNTMQYEPNAMGESPGWRGLCMGCKHGVMETSTTVRCLVTRKLHQDYHMCEETRKEEQHAVL